MGGLMAYLSYGMLVVGKAQRISKARPAQRLVAAGGLREMVKNWCLFI
jgi:hypothetical protein